MDPQTTIPVHTHEWADHGPVHRRVSWQAILSGVVVAIAVQAVLTLLGATFGLGSAHLSNPGGGPTAATVGAGTALWGSLSMLAAIFYGGFVAARLSGSTNRHEGIIQGIVVWATTLVVAGLLFSAAAGGGFAAATNAVGLAAPKMMSPPSGGESDGKRQARDLITGPTTAGMNADQAQADIAIQFPMIAKGGAEGQAAHQRVVADLQSQGVAPADAEGRVTAWEQKTDKAAHVAAETALGAAVILFFGLILSGLGGALGIAHTLHCHESCHKKTGYVRT